MTQMLSRPLSTATTRDPSTSATFDSPDPGPDPAAVAAALANPTTRLMPFVADGERVLVPADDSAGCQHVAVTADPVGGLLAQPQVVADMVDDLVAEVARQGYEVVDADQAATAERSSEDWLTHHLIDVAVWTLVTYGVHLDVDTPPRARRFYTHTHLPPDADVADALAAAATTRIVTVHEALRTGDFYRRMLDEAPRRD